MAEKSDGVRARVARRLASARDRLRDWPAVDVTYRVLVGIVGAALLCLGVIAIPYPGPGWAIVFLGLAILATEFRVFRRLLKWVRGRYDAVMEWFGRQYWAVRALGTVLTAAVTLATLWVMGVFDWTAGLAGVHWAWLNSPLGL